MQNCRLAVKWWSTLSFEVKLGFVTQYRMGYNAEEKSCGGTSLLDVYLLNKKD